MLMLNPNDNYFVVALEDRNLKRYRFEAHDGYNYWGCVVIARSKREAVMIAFREMNIPLGADFKIEVLPG
jgi:hypothetical protein